MDNEPYDCQEIQLDPNVHKTGDIWHILLCGAPLELRYGYRISGPCAPDTTGHFYNANSVLLDPYAKEIHSPSWGRQGAVLVTSRAACSIPAPMIGKVTGRSTFR
jgi:isoamylase